MGNCSGLSPDGVEQIGALSVANIGGYLKKHTEALVKDIGLEKACEISGKSKATLGRYYSDADEHSDRFMPVDTVAQLEAAADDLPLSQVDQWRADLEGVPLHSCFGREVGDGLESTNELRAAVRIAAVVHRIDANVDG